MAENIIDFGVRRSWPPVFAAIEENLQFLSFSHRTRYQTLGCCVTRRYPATRRVASGQHDSRSGRLPVGDVKPSSFRRVYELDPIRGTTGGWS